MSLHDYPYPDGLLAHVGNPDRLVHLWLVNGERLPLFSYLIAHAN